MNTLTNNIVRQKANIEKVCELNAYANLQFPREDNLGNLYVASHAGEILRFNEQGEIQVFLTIGGQPNCVTFDAEDNLYFADIANASIFYKTQSAEVEDHNSTNNKAEIQILIKDFEDSPLKGPTSLCYYREENCLLVCDGGDFGTTSLGWPKGSVFVVELETKIMRPILLECLAYPADIVYDNIKCVAYVAETYANRVIRLIENPLGVFHPSVFYQFSGRLGPTALAMDDIGNIYVARFEFQSDEGETDGLISVINKEGTLIGELIVPKLSEITGIFIPAAKKNIMYLTERNSKEIYKIKLSQFSSELENNPKII